MNGRVEIVIGSMFSGKTTELIRRISRYDAIGTKTLLINHSFDTRTGESVKTHSNQVKKALKTKNLLDIIETDEYIESSVIGIDEAQFFNDLLEFVLKSEKDKIIIIAGLDGDSNRQPFGEILNCIPLADSVVKLTAMDMISKDGTPAIFTKRISSDKDKILIGAQDEFVAVSRKNYFS